MTDHASQTDETLDLGGLSDEQIQTMSPTEVDKYLKVAVQEAGEGEPANDASKPDMKQDDAGSAAADGDEDTGSEATGGAGSEYQSLAPSVRTADRTSVDEGTDNGTEKAAAQSVSDNQSGKAAREADSSVDVNWETKYRDLERKLLGSFKASGRTVKVESPDDAQRLMQMGYDYTNKMREMKPHLKVLKTLEQNDLLDAEKLNFAIDLMKGNPEAIKKFLKDKEIDPIELDLESSTGYKPTDHRPSDQQLALDEVLDSLRSSETFPRTAQVITKEWDKASQSVLMGNPRIIAVLNDHMERGYYDQIAGKVQYERSLGRLVGLSDLDAYKVIGDAMQAHGAFAPAGRSTTPNTDAGQGPSQDSKGSDGGGEIDRRKRAASPTTGGAGTGGRKPNKNFLGDYTDEEIMKMGMPNR